MFASGGSAMVDRQKFLQIGGFEPLMSPFYWEDVELSYKAWKRGYTVRYEPRSLVRHKVSSTIGKLERSSVRAIEARNKLLFHWIHLHRRAFLVEHLMWICILTISSPVTFKLDFAKGLGSALKCLSEVRGRRAKEKTAAVRSDEQVLMIFQELEHRKDISVL